MKWSLGFIALGLFTSCVTSGREFPSSLNWIQKGKTRQEDVRLVLGEPQAVGNNSGTPSWTYGYYNYKLFGQSHTKELKFYWDNEHTVESYSFNSSFPEDKRGVAQSPVKPENKSNSDVTR